MRRRLTARPQRRPVFLGCEGQSERGYATLIGRLRDELRPDLHLDVRLLRPGGGDPLALVQRACEIIARNEHNHDIRYAVRAILLDSDKLGQNPPRDQTMLRIAEGAGLSLIWQEPSHEALLLRHLDGCQTLRPQSSAAARIELLRRWPDYIKGSSADRLSTRIGAQQIAAAASVEPSLREFLHAIGLL
jgi:hypothetical protein